MRSKTTTPILERDEWRTPRTLFDRLNAEFSFELDAAASKENALCQFFMTRKDDALSNEWNVPTFCNPPYSRGAGGTLKWCQHAFEQAQENLVPVVLLVQGDTSTKYRAFAMQHASEIRDLCHRVKFEGAKGSPPFPTAIYIFRPVHRRRSGGAHVSLWDYR